MGDGEQHNFGAWLKAARAAKFSSQYAAVGRTRGAISRGAWSALEAGNNRPRTTTIMTIVDALDITDRQEIREAFAAAGYNPDVDIPTTASEKNPAEVAALIAQLSLRKRRALVEVVEAMLEDDQPDSGDGLDDEEEPFVRSTTWSINSDHVENPQVGARPDLADHC